jgi:hypothetical protein
MVLQELMVPPVLLVQVALAHRVLQVLLAYKVPLVLPVVPQVLLDQLALVQLLD